jgi:hypothetical protein
MDDKRICPALEKQASTGSVRAVRMTVARMATVNFDG